MMILIALAASIATLLGGLAALKLKDQLHLVLGFSAGAVIAVAFFDLMPESLDLGRTFYSAQTITSFIAGGFLLYLLLDRIVFLHAHAHEEREGHDHDHGVLGTAHGHYTSGGRGFLGAASLSIHSFLDGVAIGLAFQVSLAVGAIVAVAVLTHDFSDGINTVNLVLKNKGRRAYAFRWLIADAAAPVFGIVATLFFTVPEQGLSVILAIFAGFFLYIGASDLIPESHHAHPKFLTTAMTLLGAAVLYAAIRFAAL